MTIWINKGFQQSKNRDYRGRANLVRTMAHSVRFSEPPPASSTNPCLILEKLKKKSGIFLCDLSKDFRSFEFARQVAFKIVLDEGYPTRLQKCFSGPRVLSRQPKLQNTICINTTRWRLQKRPIRKFPCYPPSPPPSRVDIPGAQLIPGRGGGSHLSKSKRHTGSHLAPSPHENHKYNVPWFTFLIFHEASIHSILHTFFCLILF